MTKQIRCDKDSLKLSYFLDGKEVSENEFHDGESAAKRAARFAKEFSKGKAPYGISDCTFMRDSANGKQFAGQEHIGDAYRRTAETAGVSTTGKKYISGLAAFPGDPEAWVDGRGDATRLLEKRGWGSEGTVNVKPRQSAEEPKPGPDVAPDLVEKYATEIAMRDPNPHLVDMANLKEQVVERLKPKNKPKKVTKADPGR